MRNFFLHLFGLIVTLGFSSAIHAQISVNAQIFAEVISSNTATEVAQLNFGRFSPGIQGGKIIISPQGVITTVGTVAFGVGAHNAAGFSITGDSDASFIITIPTEPVLLTQVSGSKTMQVVDWVSYPAAGSNIGLADGGSQIVYVGATLLVGNINDNPKGLYSGNYTINFEYN